jgi:plasmid replication initiation protein
MIFKDDKDFKDYEVRISDFSTLLNLKNKNIYAEIKDLLFRLSSRTVFIKEKNGYLISSWVSSARYIEDSGIIQLSFDRKLRPYLLELKTEFTKFNLFTIVQFRSAYTIRIYMLLKQYEKIGVREFALDEFRYNLGVKDTIYPQFKHLRTRVINQAKKELDKKDKQGDFISDITFNFEPIKKGRSIQRLRFIITKNKLKKIIPESIMTCFEQPEVTEQSKQIKNTDEFKVMRALGVAEKKIVSILGKYSAETIREKLELTAETVRKNPTGFFIKSLEEDYQSNRTTENKVEHENRVPKIPNISDGTQLQNWAISNGLPAAPVGLDTYQYRQMLQNKVERMRMIQDKESAIGDFN